MHDYQAILNIIEKELKNFESEGKVPDYIPELKNVSPDKFGMDIHGISGKHFSIGDSHEPFSIQSISKVFTLAMATIYGKKVWERVDVEPSGSPFNSLMQLDAEDGIPRNPFINAGALVIADILITHLRNPKKELLEFVRRITNDSRIDYDENVLESEKNHGYRNAALVNYMKSLGNINNSVEEILDFYFYQCSIRMSCEQLSRAFIIFANQGQIIETGEQILERINVKRINAIMQTCGFYDEAGEFSFRVGLPGKSGVGGGIVAVHPKEYAVAVWSPLLNANGNSAKGMRALEELTTFTGLSIF